MVLWNEMININNYLTYYIQYSTYLQMFWTDEWSLMANITMTYLQQYLSGYLVRHLVLKNHTKAQP